MKSSPHCCSAVNLFVFLCRYRYSSIAWFCRHLDFPNWFNGLIKITIHQFCFPENIFFHFARVPYRSVPFILLR